MNYICRESLLMQTYLPSESFTFLFYVMRGYQVFMTTREKWRAEINYFWRYYQLEHNGTLANVKAGLKLKDYRNGRVFRSSWKCFRNSDRRFY